MRQWLTKAVICASVVIPTAGLGVIGAAPAAAANAICTGEIESETVTGNVLVPPGASCEIVDSFITGSLVVQKNASLVMDESTVLGNLASTKAASIRIGSGDGLYCDEVCDAFNVGNSTIRGNVRLGGTASAPSMHTSSVWVLVNTLCNAEVGGSVTLDGNKVPFALGDPEECYGNGDEGNDEQAGLTVGGNLVLLKNVVSGHPSVVLQNVHVAKIVSCIQNNPDPTDAGGNTALFFTGECAGFGGGGGSE